MRLTSTQSILPIKMTSSTEKINSPSFCARIILKNPPGEPKIEFLGLTFADKLIASASNRQSLLEMSLRGFDLLKSSFYRIKNTLSSHKTRVTTFIDALKNDTPPIS